MLLVEDDEVDAVLRTSRSEEDKVSVFGLSVVGYMVKPDVVI